MIKNCNKTLSRCFITMKLPDILGNWRHITRWNNTIGGQVFVPLWKTIFKDVEFAKNSRLINPQPIPLIGMKLCYMRTQNFIFSIYPTESCIDYSWCCKDHWCWLHQLIKVGDAVYQIKQQITVIRLDLSIILFTIVLAINHSFTHDGHMNYLHFPATTQSAK